MNASIDFWLDELDTQITELSADELRDLRAGVPPSATREQVSAKAEAGRTPTSSASSDSHDTVLSWRPTAAFA
jgi:hypothetical protein